MDAASPTQQPQQSTTLGTRELQFPVWWPIQIDTRNQATHMSSNSSLARTCTELVVDDVNILRSRINEVAWGYDSPNILIEVDVIGPEGPNNGSNVGVYGSISPHKIFCVGSAYKPIWFIYNKISNDNPQIPLKDMIWTWYFSGVVCL